MNSVVLTGRLTRDPELRTVPSGNQVASFDIAVDRRFAKEGQQKTDFIPCQAWGKTAEFICRWFSKGKMICISGRLQMTQTEKDGNKRTYFNVVADNAEFCGNKSESDQYRQHMPSYNEPQDNGGFVDLDFDGDGEEDLPF
ncbi:MAG: single-stranded DNA-binding protein [Oscillospiraceae bacterium]|nr:single-stranded DNA-binding protein [Oscillospiraceae bacterium]